MNYDEYVSFFVNEEDVRLVIEEWEIVILTNTPMARKLAENKDVRQAVAKAQWTKLNG